MGYGADSMSGGSDGAMARVRAEDRVLCELARGMGRGRLAIGVAAARFAERDGPGALGFSNRDGHARERLSRSGRWVDDSARLARRLDALPRIRHAFLADQINWCMTDLLARRAHAAPELEDELLELALVPGVTVHAMRDYLRCDDDEEDASERCTIAEKAPVEVALLLEATRLLIEHQNGGNDYDWFECLVGEGTATHPELFDGQVMPEVPLDLDEAVARRAEGAARRREMEELAEPGLPHDDVERGDFPEPEPLPDDPRELDAVMRRESMRLTSRDLVIGRAASDFFRSAGWRRLGYATDRQYCEERLGMRRTAVWERITLARRCEGLPALAEAVSTMSIGFEAAGLVARVATPRTERAWIDRARVRMYKHLREEVRAVQADARLGVREGTDHSPPTDEEMKAYEDFERSVLSGELVERIVADGDTAPERVDEAEIRIEDPASDAETNAGEPSPPIRISARPLFDADLRELADAIATAVQARRKRRTKGEVDLRIRAHVDVARLYRAARERYRRLGEPGTFLTALCVWFWETWLDDLRQARAKWDAIHVRDRWRCASPGCTRTLCTLHHILMRILGGDDRWENLLTLCDRCHLQNIHERGSLAVSGQAPHGLTFFFGVEPLFVVRGRDKRTVAA